ncbi:MAG TPA: hypothetical protein ENJ51_09330 [Leucothrix mucor]|uniref:Uncharacterized protein n=1 Tax=Leucothrix mucor TaxID=45248 RepID=A0A7V2T0P6_LEUMU|nr:hypothetical protein [Leucothrix mucor]
MFKIKIISIPASIIISLFVTSCGGGGGSSSSNSTLINAMDYLTPNKTISKLHKEYTEAADGSISLQDFTTFHYTKTGHIIRETTDDAISSDYTTYQKLSDTIEIKDYKNNILVKTTSHLATIDVNDNFFTEVDDDGDSTSCNYTEKLASFTTAYKIFSDLIKLDCTVTTTTNLSTKFNLYLAKNMGIIHTKTTANGKTYKSSYIGEPLYSLNTLAKYSTSYASSVAVADNGNTVFIGDENGLITLDASNLNNLTKLSSINSGEFTQSKLSKDENLLYAVDGGNFLIIDISNRNDIHIISSMQMNGADSFSLSDNETIAVIQDFDITQIVDISNKSNIVALFDLKSGKSAISNDGQTLFYISPDSPKEIVIYDINNPSNDFVSTTPMPYDYSELLLSHSGKELFVSDQQNITIFNVDNPNNISQLSTYNGGHVESMQSKISLSADDKTLFISSEETLQLLDLSDLTNIHTVAARSYDLGDIGDVASTSDKLFIADGANGLQILEK